MLSTVCVARMRESVGASVRDMRPEESDGQGARVAGTSVSEGKLSWQILSDH